MSWVAAKIAQRLLKVERQLELMHSYRVEQRLLLTLADLASRPEGNGSAADAPVEIPLTQGELASLVGATRETTSTILNLFERKGWVQLRRGALYVPSAASLARAVEEP
ncbi:MAG: Crp/Fnr family transcriptional regulator [Acidobacteriota bacterium]